MYAAILGDATFYQFLLQIDRDLAAETRGKPCRWCGAALHSANYPRRPRGLGPTGIDLGPEFGVCFSFCCSADGCRRRHRAPSVRFLGPKVYLSVMVLLLAAMRQGPTRRTARELKEQFGVDRRTLVRWREWWRSIVPRSTFWQRARGLLATSRGEDELPQFLIDRFAARDRRERVVMTLKLLSGLFGAFSAF